MPPEVAYALAWMALAGLLTWINLKAGTTALKLVTFAAMSAAVALAFMTLLGVL